MIGFWDLTAPSHNGKPRIRCPNCGRAIGYNVRRDGQIVLCHHKNLWGKWCMPGMPNLNARIRHVLRLAEEGYTPLTPFRPPQCPCRQYRHSYTSPITLGEYCDCGHNVGIHPGMGGCQAETPPLSTFNRTNPREETRSMATVNICDRCGAFGKNDVMCGIGINSGRDKNNQEIQYKSFEVCSECRAEFDTWMVAPVNRAGVSIRDKYQGEVEVDPKQAALMKLAAKEYAEAQANMAAQAKKQLEA